MQGQRTERTSAPAAPVRGDAGGDHLHRRDGVLIGGMRTPGEGQIVQAVQFLGGQGRGGRREQDGAVAVGLHEEAAGLMRFAFEADRAVEVGPGVVEHRVVRRQADEFEAVQFRRVGGDGGRLHQPGRTGNPGPQVGPEFAVHGLQHGQVAHQFGHGVEPPGHVDDFKTGTLFWP